MLQLCVGGAFSQVTSTRFLIGYRSIALNAISNWPKAIPIADLRKAKADTILILALAEIPLQWCLKVNDFYENVDVSPMRSAHNRTGMQ